MHRNSIPLAVEPPSAMKAHELYDLDTMPAERAVTGTELVNGFYSVVTFVSSFRFRG